LVVVRPVRGWSGEKVQSVSLTDPGGSGNTVYLQVGAIGDPTTAGQVMGVNASGQASVADAQSAAFAGAVAMTVGTTYTAQRSVGVLCTVAGNVVLQFPDASTLTLPVAVGWQTFPFQCTQIVSSGTTATATYFNLK
jgi:hypothetical protein